MQPSFTRPQELRRRRTSAATAAPSARPFVRAVTGFEASSLEPGDDASAHHGVLVARGGLLVVEPVSRWDFGGPVGA